MNSVLLDIMKKTAPRMNKDVTDGAAKKILEIIPEYFDDIIRSSIKSLNPSVDLKYLGYRRLTPKEEFNLTLMNSNNKSNYDLAESYIYMVEFIFEYQGQKISRPLYLPYCERGNIIRISNTQYHITPVLSDMVISPSFDRVFVRLLKDKLTFLAESKNFILNNEKVPGIVVHTNIVKTNAMNIVDNIGKPLTSISLYILGKYGFKESMNKFVGTDKWLITKDNVDHLRDEYNVFESTKVKPRSLKLTAYVGHDVKICIHKSVKLNNFIENFIFGIIYTMDILPSQSDDMVNVVNNSSREGATVVEHEEEILFWRILLGRIIYKNSFSIDRIFIDMSEHFDNLNGYIDSQIKNKLKENGMIIDDFFELLGLILSNYNLWLINSKEYNSDIKNRYIDILYYIMCDMIIGFNKVIISINKRVSKKANMRIEEITKVLTNELSTRKIFNIAKSQSPSLCLMVVDSSSDLIYPKITAVFEDQSRGSGPKRNNTAQFPEHTKTLRGNQLVIGSLLNLTKSAPSPVFRINPFLNYNIYNGIINIDPDIQKSVEVLDKLLLGRLDNENVEILDNEDTSLD